MEAAAREVETRAKQLAPVDTGALRRSIRAYREGRANWWVSANVDYAVHQEFGTRYQTGTPFLRPARDSVESDMASIVREGLA